MSSFPFPLLDKAKTALHVRGLRRLLEHWKEEAGMACPRKAVLTGLEKELFQRIRKGLPWGARFAFANDKDALPVFVQVFETVLARQPRPGGVEAFARLVPESWRPGVLGACLPFCKTVEDWNTLCDLGASLQLPDTFSGRTGLLHMLTGSFEEARGLAQWVRAGHLRPTTAMWKTSVTVRDFDAEGTPVLVRQPCILPMASFALTGHSPALFDWLMASAFDASQPVPSSRIAPGKMFVDTATAIEVVVEKISHEGEVSPEEAVRRLKALHAAGCPLYGTRGCLSPRARLARLFEKAFDPARQEDPLYLDLQRKPRFGEIQSAMHDALDALEMKDSLGAVLSGAAPVSRSIRRI